MNRTKHVFKLLLFASAAALLYFLGAGKDLATQNAPKLTIGNLLQILFVIAAVMAALYLLLLLLGLVKTKNARVHTLLMLTSNLARYIAIIVIIIAVLSLLNVDMPTILAGLGVIALIIGFGAEALITDVVTGFFILIDNQYNVGDIIEVNGFRGVVSDIGIRTTSLTDVGGNVKIINNSDMKNILNRSHNRSIALTDFAIPYSTDLEALEKEIPDLLQRIYEDHADVFTSAPVYLGVQSLSESSVDLRFTAEVGEADIYAGTRLLNHDLLIGFRRLGVECPFPQLDVHAK